MKYRSLAAALAASALLPLSAAHATDLEVTHWWTSGGEAAAVAEFGMLLRDSPLRGNASFESVTARARTFKGDDEDGYRAQFIQLVERAAMLQAREPTRTQSRR